MHSYLLFLAILMPIVFAVVIRFLKISVRQKEIANLVGKNNMELISAISICYPDENPKQRTRKNLNEILEWYDNGK